MPSLTWLTARVTATAKTLVVAGCLPQRYQEELAKNCLKWIS